ncbi:MAG: CdvA-like protein [Nitrososphaerota archaeon]|jgi:chromosome segregation ATPase|nr:CdvA-like protein [Nitrososphaerota archaeon]MDG6937203.1 CdvA-like protein [Nitrososphaerota archaeon]MDG6961782.1 CdvA-like protein [Nitrososphaerota archaeon]MDG6970316.1 CdvA-like protein [Nitrososphaerota archaeon]MDG6972445.1 CdvA-like protein [Nitrososphaerota archaeon]
MRAEALGKLVDKPVKDTYGRYVGFVVGFSVDTSGELKSVGVDQGNGDFTEYPSQRIVSTSEGFVLIPAWRVESDALGKEIEGVKRRAKALQDLAREGEIPRTLFEESMTKYSDDASKIQDSYKSLAESMAVRIGELEGQRETLDRFLVDIKVQFRAGEIDEAAFKVAAESCQAMQRRNSQEMEDLSRMLKTATEPLSQQQEKREEKQQQKQVAQAPVQKAVQATAE